VNELFYDDRKKMHNLVSHNIHPLAISLLLAWPFIVACQWYIGDGKLEPCLLGNIPALGNWSPDHAIELKNTASIVGMTAIHDISAVSLR
jgi:hypothetical protein